MRAKSFSFLLCAGLLTASAAQAGWRDQASQFDIDRFAHFAEARAKGINAAQSGTGSGNKADIAAALNPPPARATPAEFVGTWRCRTIKLGGITPYIVYPSWFTCRISRRDGELFFEKINGSQRTRGYLYEDDGAYVYLGAYSAGDEPPHRYSGRAASAGAPTTPDDQIGILTMTGTGHARLELPYPVQELTFDVLELKR